MRTGIDTDDAMWVAEAYRDKARAELAAADRCVPGSENVACSGDPLAVVMLVKGERGPAESSGGAALTGADGDAAGKALVALGFDPDSVFACLSRPVGRASHEAYVTRLRLTVEAVDPSVIIGLDACAAEDVAAAIGLQQQPPFGVPVRAAGRTFVCVDGLEASLTDEGRKRRVWRQFRAAVPVGPVW